jgi:hypothetical protein
MRFAAVIRQKLAPAPTPQPIIRPGPDELARGAQPVAPQPQEEPVDLDQLVRLVGEW